MNTLKPTLQNKIHNWNGMKNAVETINSGMFPFDIEGIHSGMHGFFIAELAKQRHTELLQKLQYTNTVPVKEAVDFLLVVPTEKDVETLITDLHGAFPPEKDSKTGIEKPTAEILTFPWWGLVPYRPASKGSLVFGERAALLSKLSQKNIPFTKDSIPRFFVATQRAVQTPVPPKEYVQNMLFSISKGDLFDPQSFAENLVMQGYIRVPKVTVKGEFTLRGEVLDIFMPGEIFAHRINFDFDKIERIKTFTPENQAAYNEIETLLIYPMKEVIWDDERVGLLEEQIKKLHDEKGVFSNNAETLLSELYVNKQAEGEELFYSLSFSKEGGADSIFDYLSEEMTLIMFDYDRLANAQESFNNEYNGLYKRAIGEGREVPPPENLLFNFSDINSKCRRTIRLRSIRGDDVEQASRIIFNTEPPRSFFGNVNYLKEQLDELTKDDWNIYIFADSINQSLRIKEILKDFPSVEIVPLSISSGFIIPEEKILVIQENEIFGRKRHIPKSVKYVKSAVIDTFVELNPEDYVVHVNYGIGLFKGIERVRAVGNERDYIKIEYADEENVFIPIEQVNLVQRYIGNEGEAPKLDRLGSKTWENRKNKVKKSVEDIAERLIQLYSKRKAVRGFAFPKDNEFQSAFEAAFPYDETDDQLTCIEEVKSDMERSEPMDRLICGDVGFGKTEIAMRAAFKAVLGGKQVAFLAPTTILAEQHYETCVERFEHFPIKIAHMSRFVQPKEQKKILEKLKNGEVDILIGTHRIIQKDVVFKDLGLMIIDEEQRFGVKDKERLKELKTSIDSLAMSATPIPRSLHMSLLKIRDMSILNTPPHNRQPIETIIDAYSNERVAAAIRREVERGGQVFYLHNRVESLAETRLKLERLVPEMLIDMVHGKMSSTELDDAFHRFKMGGFHVLVSTTIIENGIDVPNVNTIIIDRADIYGVSQLYQLRGRVGRSDRKAYAYLLYPEGRALSEIAMKRLQVISDFTELGSGFKIAMKDMEIRGAGNLLGKDQSGDVYSVGFDLYLRLLENAIQRLSNEDFEEEQDALLELEYTGYIPETYIINPQTKMEIYKKIASVSSSEELDKVCVELNDRFGSIPNEVQSLLALAEIRILCKKLSISTLKEKNGEVHIEFSKISKVSVEKVLMMMKSNPGQVKLDHLHPNVLILKIDKIGLKEKSEFLREKIQFLLV